MPLSPGAGLTDDCWVLLEILVYVVAMVVILLLGRLTDDALGRLTQTHFRSSREDDEMAGRRSGQHIRPKRSRRPARPFPDADQQQPVSQQSTLSSSQQSIVGTSSQV